MNDEDVRMLNSEFNYRHYGAFYEKMEEAQANNGDGADEAALNGKDEDGNSKSNDVQSLVGFANIVSEDNILSQMWQKVKIDDKFGDYYEKWLEEEVWTYYD